ncbi:MAG: hypothetical protein Fur0014_04270 [Rubrivivax sp.]
MRTSCARTIGECQAKRSPLAIPPHGRSAGSASRHIGRKTAVCTSAARNDEPEISTIVHAAAVAA